MFRTQLSRRGLRTPRLLLALLTSAMLAGHFTSAAARTSHGVTTVGIYDATASTFHLRNSNTQGIADIIAQFGPSPASQTCGRPAPYFCSTDWYPLAGDWDGDGVDTIGLYYQPTGYFFLKNSDAAGPADITFQYGVPGTPAGWLPLVGDWDGDGIDTIGMYHPPTAHFFLRNSNSAGPANIVFQYGPGGVDWVPMAGDWDGNGLDNVGVYNPSVTAYFLKNTNTPGPADIVFVWAPTAAGNTGFPLAGDWDADGTDTVGLYAPNEARFYLKNSNAAGQTDITVPYGPASTNGRILPVVGDWDGL